MDAGRHCNTLHQAVGADDGQAFFHVRFRHSEGRPPRGVQVVDNHQGRRCQSRFDFPASGVPVKNAAGACPADRTGRFVRRVFPRLEEGNLPFDHRHAPKIARSARRIKDLLRAAFDRCGILGTQGGETDHLLGDPAAGKGVHVFAHLNALTNHVHIVAVSPPERTWWSDGEANRERVG